MKLKEYFPYDEYGKIKVEKHGTREFVLGSSLKYVIDSKNIIIDSSESHYEDLGYYDLIDFGNDDINPEILDLRWMNEIDRIRFFQANESYYRIRKIKINIDNLDCSYLLGFGITNNIELEIYSSKYKRNFIEELGLVNAFIRDNNYCLSNVTFIGFSKVMTTLLNTVANDYFENKEKILRR